MYPIFRSVQLCVQWPLLSIHSLILQLCGSSSPFTQSLLPSHTLPKATHWLDAVQLKSEAVHTTFAGAEAEVNQEISYNTETKILIREFRQFWRYPDTIYQNGRKSQWRNFDSFINFSRIINISTRGNFGILVKRKKNQELPKIKCIESDPQCLKLPQTLKIYPHVTGTYFVRNLTKLRSRNFSTYHREPRLFHPCNLLYHYISGSHRHIDVCYGKQIALWHMSRVRLKWTWSQIKLIHWSLMKFPPFLMSLFVCSWYRKFYDLRFHL